LTAGGQCDRPLDLKSARAPRFRYVLTAHDLPRQGLGCMTMRDDSVGDPDRDPAAVVHAALDAGVTMVDTAHMYGKEALVGRAVAPRRDEVLLATKFGVLWRADGDWYARRRGFRP
jgi:aryl-alcohol dehydrogenase-like predicted oxidoreductase